MKPRYVFVGGLHRSGTSLLARLISEHPMVSGIEDAPVPENEGVYLQGAIPHLATHGQPGKFGYNAQEHLTEESRFNTSEVAQRLASEWEPWFDAIAPWRIEKSPINLLRMRLYQQLFPTSQFILMVRHPLACVRATAKWSDAGEAALLDHWEVAYAKALEDLAALHCWMVVRYEDLARAPEQELGRVWRFLDVPEHPVAADIKPDLNLAYADGAAPSAVLGPIAQRFGYRVDDLAAMDDLTLRGRHYYNSITSTL